MTLGLPAVGQPGDVTKRDHPVVVIVGQRPRRYGTGGAPGGALFHPALAVSTGELDVADTHRPHPAARARAPVILLLGGLRAFVRTY